MKTFISKNNNVQLYFIKDIRAMFEYFQQHLRMSLIFHDFPTGNGPSQRNLLSEVCLKNSNVIWISFDRNCAIFFFR